MIGAHLIAMAGLPGAGKSSIANGLCRALGATLLSVDPIEAAMWRSGLGRDATGRAAYEVAEALAAENLRQGQTVIVDAVNPVEEARLMWLNTAQSLTLPISYI
ncbi:MAG: AAA family ATPase [Pseudomonadota bacterium]